MLSVECCAQTFFSDVFVFIDDAKLISCFSMLITQKGISLISRLFIRFCVVCLMWTTMRQEGDNIFGKTLLVLFCLSIPGLSRMQGK